MKTDKQKTKLLHMADFLTSSALFLALAGIAVYRLWDGEMRSIFSILAVLALCLAVNSILKIRLNESVKDVIYFYERLLDCIPFMLHTTDLDMKWLFLNKATTDFLKLDRDEAIGQHCSRWNAEICNTERCSAECLRNGQPTTYFRQDGMDLRVDTNWLVDRYNNHVGFVEVVQDISKMVHIKQQEDLIVQIREVCDNFVTATREIAIGAQSLADGTMEQAASVESLSFSMEQVNKVIDQNVRQAEEIAELSKTMRSDAQSGSTHMEKLTMAVGEINNASQAIKGVIHAIDDIAFQTNILALNAAVEAARAGQHGKGFAVVAEEVRNLASKSAEAARDTSALIENSIKKAELGASISIETAQALEKIIDSIRKSIPLIDSIAHSSREHHDAAQQISASINQVSNVVQQNSATAEQSAAASEQMNSQTTSLQQLLDDFQSFTAPPTATHRETGMLYKTI